MDEVQSDFSIISLLSLVQNHFLYLHPVFKRKPIESYPSWNSTFLHPGVSFNLSEKQTKKCSLFSLILIVFHFIGSKK